MTLTLHTVHSQLTRRKLLQQAVFVDFCGGGLGAPIFAKALAALLVHKALKTHHHHYIQYQIQTKITMAKFTQIVATFEQGW